VQPLRPRVTLGFGRAKVLFPTCRWVRTAIKGEWKLKAKKWIVVALASALAVGALGLSGCGSKSTTTTSGNASELTGSINVAGSDTMVNLAQAWAEKFGEENPGVMVSVKGGGSGVGIAALINKTVDFADASREIKSEEESAAKAAGVNPVETEVAKDGVVIIVNKDNAVTAITKEQLGKVYAGEITNWKDLGGTDAQIVILGRDSSSGTYGFVKDEVLGKLPNKPEYSKAMLNLQSTQAIVDEVAKNPNGIGYIGLGYENPSIKPIDVDGTTASVETVLDGTYALSRGLFMYSDGEPAAEKKAYIDWILSDAGQSIIKEQGFVPLAK
jgi:phosphate transport system substrate-binding protein